MKLFYGAAIQGDESWGARAELHRSLHQHIRSLGWDIVTEHTSGENFEAICQKMEDVLGPLPKPGTPERRRFVRDMMIQFVESDIGAAVFEVTTPSLGTGVEVAHAALRPRLGLSEIPILLLYEQNGWKHDLSTMIRGLDSPKFPNIILSEYRDISHAKEIVARFLSV